MIGAKATATVKLIPSPILKELSFKTCYAINWKGDQDTSRVLDIGNVYLGIEKAFVADLNIGTNLQAMQSDIA